MKKKYGVKKRCHECGKVFVAYTKRLEVICPDCKNANEF